MLSNISPPIASSEKLLQTMKSEGTFWKISSARLFVRYIYYLGSEVSAIAVISRYYYRRVSSPHRSRSLGFKFSTFIRVDHVVGINSNAVTSSVFFSKLTVNVF